MIAVKKHPTDATEALPSRLDRRRRLLAPFAKVPRWLRFRHLEGAAAVEPLFWDREVAYLFGLAAVRQSEWCLAERELTNGNGHTGLSDARCLNLLGVVYEATDRWGLARRCYSRAIRADKRYVPPQINIRRHYELATFGQSMLPISLGTQKDVM